MIQRQSETVEEHDVFFLVRDAVDYEDRVKNLRSWIEGYFEEARVLLNDPDSMEPYIDLTLDVETEEGEFRLVYYENDELVLRGDRKVVEEIRDPVSRELDLNFRRV